MQSILGGDQHARAIPLGDLSLEGPRGEGDEGRLDAQLSQRADEGSGTRNEKARLGCSEVEKEGEGVGTCPVERCP